MTMKSNVKHNEVKVRMADDTFTALKNQSAALGLSHSGLLGMLFMDWLKGCVKDNQRQRHKEVARPGLDRARFGAFARPQFHPRM